MRTITGRGAVALTALAVLAACASGTPATSAAGKWTFTDDLGRTVTLDHRPTRVAGLTDVVGSLWNYGIQPVASFGYAAMDQDERFAGKDTSRVVQLGKAYGEINLEALAAAHPDLIVTNAYPVDRAGKLDPAKPLYGFKDVAQQQQVAKIAPIVTIAMRGSAVDVTKRTADLAVALGADPSRIAATRATYEAATARLRTAAASGLRVLVVAAYPTEGLYVAKAPDDPALRSYADLGVRFVDPGGKDYYWETVSWENVGSLPADVVLYSRRAMDAAAMLAQPTFARTPAARAGQVYRWVFAGMDYVDQAAYVTELAGRLSGAHRVS
jgi:iron complex transport system substrate-binding protein